MKTILTFTLLVFASICAAQNNMDIVVLKKGDTLYCKILNPDNNGLWIVEDVNGELQKRLIPAGEIERLETSFNKATTKDTLTKFRPLPPLPYTVVELKKDINRAGKRIQIGSIVWGAGGGLGMVLTTYGLLNRNTTITGLGYSILSASSLFGISIILSSGNVLRKAGELN